MNANITKTVQWINAVYIFSVKLFSNNSWNKKKRKCMGCKIVFCKNDDKAFDAKKEH